MKLYLFDAFLYEINEFDRKISLYFEILSIKVILFCKFSLGHRRDTFILTRLRLSVRSSSHNMARRHYIKFITLAAIDLDAFQYFYSYFTSNEATVNQTCKVFFFLLYNSKLPVQFAMVLSLPTIGHH